ncbi:hypothetical protein SUGI_0685540 [Cryptomeria japonica]|nr:hypothetical protein SUGI_0685540 [Cryptomeria japonica]
MSLTPMRKCLKVTWSGNAQKITENSDVMERNAQKITENSDVMERNQLEPLRECFKKACEKKFKFQTNWSKPWEKIFVQPVMALTMDSLVGPFLRGGLAKLVITTSEPARWKKLVEWDRRSYFLRSCNH